MLRAEWISDYLPDVAQFAGGCLDVWDSESVDSCSYSNSPQGNKWHS